MKSRYSENKVPRNTQNCPSERILNIQDICCRFLFNNKKASNEAVTFMPFLKAVETVKNTDIFQKFQMLINVLVMLLPLLVVAMYVVTTVSTYLRLSFNRKGQLYFWQRIAVRLQLYILTWICIFRERGKQGRKSDTHYNYGSVYKATQPLI